MKILYVHKWLGRLVREEVNDILCSSKNIKRD
jgi:hypothetical protein